MNPSLNSLSLFHSINTFVFKFSSSKVKLFCFYYSSEIFYKGKVFKLKSSLSLQKDDSSVAYKSKEIWSNLPNVAELFFA